MPFWKRPVAWLYFFNQSHLSAPLSLRVPAGLINKKENSGRTKSPRRGPGPGPLHEPDWTNCVVCVCVYSGCVCVCRCGHTPLKQTHLISLVPRVSQRRRRVERSSRSFGEVWFCESDVDVLITSLRFSTSSPPAPFTSAPLSVSPSVPRRTNEKCRAAREERERKDRVPRQHRAAAL